jgi:hypothetical protein
MTFRIAGLAAALVLAVPAFAQAPPVTKPPVEPKGEQGKVHPCADTGAIMGDGRDVDARPPREQDKSLSQKLAQSNGVICPPPTVDRGISKPTPPGGAMPVIPPPGSPGGDPDVQPK